jgi:hypothetical protein
MLLRSSNNQTVLSLDINGFTLASVVYPGPLLQAAVVVWRVQLINTLAPGGSFFELGFRLEREVPRSHRYMCGGPLSDLGVSASLSFVAIMDLLPGDVMLLIGRQATANRWSMAASGLTVRVF